MTRTPYLKPEEMSEEQRRVYEDIVRTRGTWLNGPYAPLLHSPELADKAQLFGELVRYRTTVPPRLSELAIIITARHWDCDFEWYQHAKIALKAGITEAVCDAIANGVHPPFANQDEFAVYEFTSELLLNHSVKDETYSKVKSLLGVRGVVELTSVIGYYSFIAFTLNAHEVPLPNGVSPVLPHLDKPTLD